MSDANLLTQILVNLKLLHFGIYFKYLLYLFDDVLKDIISDLHIEIMKVYL